MKVCFQNALTPALSHPMGEGESHAVSLEFVSAGFARRVAHGCCRTGVAPVSDFQFPALAERFLELLASATQHVDFFKMETGATPVLREGCA
jgi:hypothetical protein